MPDNTILFSLCEVSEINTFKRGEVQNDRIVLLQSEDLLRHGLKVFAVIFKEDKNTKASLWIICS